MICPRCKTAGRVVYMKQVKRKGGFHKQTKWTCPSCGCTRMQHND